MLNIIYYILVEYVDICDQVKIFSIAPNYNKAHNKCMHWQYLDRLTLMSNLIKLRNITQYKWYLLMGLPEPSNIDELIMAHCHPTALNLIHNKQTVYHLNIAITSNNYKMINYLVSKNIKFNNKSLENSVLHGHLKLSKFILNSHITYDNNLLLLACQSHNLQMVMFIYSLLKFRIYKLLHSGITLCAKIDNAVLNQAILCASTYDIVLYLYNNIDTLVTPDFILDKNPKLISEAIRNNDLKLMQWYINFGIKMPKDALEIAIDNNHMALFNHLSKNNKINMRALALLAKHGHFELLKKYDYMFVNEFNIRDDVNMFLSIDEQFKQLNPDEYLVFAYACYNGNMQIVQYLETKNVPRDDLAMYYAIANNNIHVVQYLPQTMRNIDYFEIYTLLYNRLNIAKLADAKHITQMFNYRPFWKAINIAIANKYYEVVQFYYLMYVSEGNTFKKFKSIVQYDKEFFNFIKKNT